jgi:hypothetical protein
MELVVPPLLQSSEPVNDPAVKTELPQLLTTVTVGAEGIVLGAATPLAGVLVHPLIVCVTVYVPAEVTVMDEVVAPLLHNKDPVNDPAVNMELPQLFVTVTVGVVAEEFNGAATPLPGKLVHPVTDCVTVYVPATVTVIDELVEPLLHNSEPVKPEAVNTELPQLLVTVTAGADGVAIGAAVPLPAVLVHPLTVWVTVNVAALVTVIEEVVAPLLHNREPVNDPAVNTELPQLLTTVTAGAVGTVVGTAIPLAGELVQPSTVCVTV